MAAVDCTWLNSACVQDCEEGAVKELLMKGENLQKRVPDEDKREQLRLKHNQLNSKYNTVKVTHTPLTQIHNVFVQPLSMQPPSLCLSLFLCVCVCVGPAYTEEQEGIGHRSPVVSVQEEVT